MENPLHIKDDADLKTLYKKKQRNGRRELPLLHKILMVKSQHYEIFNKRKYVKKKGDAILEFLMHYSKIMCTQQMSDARW